MNTVAAEPKPTGSRRVPKDLSGQPIPLSKRWLYSTPSFANGALESRVLPVILTGAYVSFNSSSIGQSTYEYLHHKYGDYSVNLWGAFIITSVFFWVWAGIFAIPDLTGWPRWLFKYKTQPFVRVDGYLYLRFAAISLRNQLVAILPVFMLKATISPSPVHPAALPSPLQTIATILFDAVCMELAFYSTHRLFHSKLLYHAFHKKHHAFGPVALASTYCTISEHVFVNIFSTVVGPVITPHHWSLFVFIFVLGYFVSLCTHSGYNIPWMPSNLRHDFHHFASDENFGPLGILDGICQTNKKYRKMLDEAISRVDGDGGRARKLVLEKLANIESVEATQSQ